MPENYTYNSTHLTTVLDGSIELTEKAELGAVGEGRLTLEDVPGTLAIVGQKNFAHTESNAEQFGGFVGDRTYQRGEQHVGASRDIEVAAEDLNSMLGHRLIDDQLPDVTAAQGGKRPSETVGQRLTWLLASSFLSGLVSDNGLVDYPTTTMDKADYRQQFPGDVLADCALAAMGFNYFIYRDQATGEPSLWFRNSNTSTVYTSSLRISNVAADVDSTVTFAPSTDATLTRSPANVKSKIAYSHAKGTVVVERAATATAFNGERAGTASNTNVKTDAQARAQATAMLGQLRTEEDLISCAITVPAASVNGLRAGHRIQAKFSHLNTEGYGSFTWFRVLERNVKPIVADAGLYELRLKLSPQETADAAGVCSDLYANTPSATYYPLGGPGPGGGSNANLSDGVVYYLRPGVTYPVTPEPGHQSIWHFPRYGAGGVGTIDYPAADCQNELRFIVVGNGTATIQTEKLDGGAGFSIFRGTPANVYRDSLGLGYAGGAIEVAIGDATGGDCVRIFGLRAFTGPGWNGWSQMVWVAA